MNRTFAVAIGFLTSVLSAELINAQDIPHPAAAKSPAPKQGGAEHVVLMVWDGLRPDSVTKRNTPTLYKLSRQGVTFAHNHSVYPASTEVNGTAIATGVYPGTSGIVANKEYRPDINPRKPVPTESLDAIRGGDKTLGEKYLAVATLAETVQSAGYPTAVAGTKGVALLHDRSENRASEAARKSSVIFAGKTIPPSLLDSVVQAQGPAPLVAFPNTAQDAWTTKALIETLWKNEVPRLSVLWLSDPDYSQHDSAPGAPEAHAALKSCDNNLATVMAALEAKGIRDKTDIFIVSDHGFSTIKNGIDMSAELANAGFDASRELSTTPKPGQILMVGLGGSIAFYVVNHDPAVTAKLVKFLQRSKFAGVILTREKMDGTFTLDTLHVKSTAAPDVFMAFRWSDEPNHYGVPGLILSDGTNNAGKGTHASMSKYELHNTLIAAGPDLRRQFTDRLPSGNIDVAPTILAVLGINPAQPVEGRVLSEALIQRKKQPDVMKPVHSTLMASEKLDGGTWRQYLQVTKIGGEVYFDEGNGRFSEAPPATPKAHGAKKTGQVQ